MAVESLDFSFKTRSDLALSVSDLKARYFMGIPIVQSDGTPLSDVDIEFYIRAAQRELETQLDIKLTAQVIEETKDFLWDHYNSWGYIRATYPVKCINKVDGFIGTTRQVEYPSDWFQIKKTNDDIVHRTINIVPTNNGSSTSQSIVYSGIYPQLGYYGSRQIPQYWTIKYTTGFDSIPEELLKVLGMMAAIPLFDMLGDIILSAGVTSQSIGLDGLSQNITTNSGYSARIKSYQKSIELIMPDLRKRYTGFTFGTM